MESTTIEEGGGEKKKKQVKHRGRRQRARASKCGGKSYKRFAPKGPKTGLAPEGQITIKLQVQVPRWGSGRRKTKEGRGEWGGREGWAIREIVCTKKTRGRNITANCHLMPHSGVK